MIESEEDQLKDWSALYQKISQTLGQYGTEDPFRQGDYWIVDESNGLRQHKIYFNNLKMLLPNVVRALQALLAPYLQWEIFVAIYLPGAEGDSLPDMGLIIRKHEIVDGLQRQYLPPEFQNIRYEGSRPGTDRD
jgi:hypothetical protein